MLCLWELRSHRYSFAGGWGRRAGNHSRGSGRAATQVPQRRELDYSITKSLSLAAPHLQPRSSGTSECVLIHCTACASTLSCIPHVHSASSCPKWEWRSWSWLEQEACNVSNLSWYFKVVPIFSEVILAKRILTSGPSGLQKHTDKKIGVPTSPLRTVNFS